MFDDDPVSGPTLQRLLGPSIDLQIARIPFPPAYGDESGTIFERSLQAGAASILPSAPPRAIGFACTTGAIELGRERVAAAVARPDARIEAFDPVHAAYDAFRTLRVKRVAIVSPYDRALSIKVADAIFAEGFEVTNLTYLDADDVVAISDASILDATRAAAQTESEALFLSCTGMRSVPLIDQLESELGRPVLASLQVLAWRMASAFGKRPDGPGRLLRDHPAGPI